MNNKLLLNKKIYDKKYIIHTIKDFSNMASIKLESNYEYWICYFYKCKVSITIAMYEFENYLIGLSNREGV